MSKTSKKTLAKYPLQQFQLKNILGLLPFFNASHEINSHLSHLGRIQPVRGEELRFSPLTTPLNLFVQLMRTNVRNNFSEPLASTGETRLFPLKKPDVQDE
jgi:hypothetical protein